MKQFNSHIIFLLLFSFILTLNISCKSNISKQQRIFEKKPNFENSLNRFAKPIGYVNDYGGLYTADQVYEMDSLIYKFEAKTALQIVVVTFDSTMAKANEIDSITRAIGNGWKIGGDSSKGIVVGISKVNRRMRIENGKYIQRIISDYDTKVIVDSFFIPEFKKDKYFEGTLAGIKALMIFLQNAITVKF